MERCKLNYSKKKEVGVAMNKHYLSKFSDIDEKSYDLFICSSSFEDRCLSISKNMKIEHIQRALVFYNSECIEHVGENHKLLMDIFGDKAIPVELLISEPIVSADVMMEALKREKEFRHVDSILFDITTFTHECLLVMLRLLQIVFRDSEIVCVYSNALEYDSSNSAEKKWLSKGVGEIRSVLGYSGDIVPTRKTHLIVIVGYEYERAIKIISAFEPSSLALGYGSSRNATTEKDKDANEGFVNIVEQMAPLYSALERFEIVCDNPFDTYNRLKEQIYAHSDKNIVIVPLNNKLSTLGVALIAMEFESIQLCYAPAVVYNYSSYSIAGDSFFTFNISDVFKELSDGGKYESN